MKRILLLTFLFFTAFSIVHAQGTIKGKLYDSTNKSALGLATVTVFKAADTSLITYRLSNPEGEFKVPGIPLNEDLRVIISYSGYDAYRKEFKLSYAAALDLGTVNMMPSSKSLEEVLVIAERPPVTVKRDTIEFNASSFKTLPTSLVEDLLRKLPGVQVESDGSITANGKKVNRILVDGKAFFGDDPKMATRNLPANVIDKVQVVDDKEEAQRNIDGDLTNVGKVLNLTLKKGIKKGWFGKLYAGMGTKDRYEAGGIANIYRDTLQLSVLAFSNNVNRSGFSFSEVQDMGGFKRSGQNSVMVMSRGSQSGFAINGISFGGLDQGISQTSGGGFNLNHAPNKNNSFFLQYFYGRTNNHLEMVNNIEQFIKDTSVTNRTTSLSEKIANTHNLSAGFKLKPDTLTNVEFRSTYSFSGIDEEKNNLVNVSNSKYGEVSKGLINQFNDQANHSYNHNFFYTHRSKNKQGRVWNINNFFNYNNKLYDYLTESNNEYYIPVFNEREFDQLRKQKMPNISSNTNVSYAEPLNKHWTLRFNNRHEYLRDKQDISTYDKDLSSYKYELLNYAQSSGFVRDQNKVTSYLGLSYKLKGFSFSAGLAGLWQDINNQFRNIQHPINTNLFNIVPSANIQWKQLSGNYSLNINAPGINYLLPVPDSTNPFYIRYGNPYLKPSRQHQFYLSNFNFFQGKASTFNLWINGNITDNDVISSRTVTANGVQIDKPVNANGTRSLQGSLGYGKEYKNKQKFMFSYRISSHFNYDHRKIIVNDNASTAETFSYGPTFNIGLNWNDIVEFRPMFSSGHSRTTYTDPSFKNIDFSTKYMEGELIIRWPKKIVWESNLSYRETSNVAPGLPKDNLLWNAAVTLLMFKGDIGMLKLGVYDVLNRNTGFWSYATQNQFVQQQSNVLQRFTSLTFTYNIRNMGAPKKVGGRDRLFMF
jgi:hypothetical protein